MGTILRISKSFMGNHCTSSDITEWILFLLSLQSIPDRNGDANKLMIVPLFFTLNGLLQMALIHLFDAAFIHQKIEKNICNKWIKMISSSNDLLIDTVVERIQMTQEQNYKKEE